MKEEKTITIDIRLSRGWAVLLCCLLVTTLVIGFDRNSQMQAEASTAENAATTSSGMRQFYLTADGDNYGSIAKSQCANGYHMASLWEMADPSNLKYNMALGFSQSDNGFGPPAGEATAFGWVHTGYISNSSTTPGRANCGNYTIHSFYQYGTAAALHSQWTSGAQDIGPWDVQIQECDNYLRVWCIED